MSLIPSNFDDMERDAKRWDRKGLGYREARQRLEKLDTTVWPIAVHAAGWIQRNWDKGRIKKLGREHVALYNRAVSDVHPGVE